VFECSLCLWGPVERSATDDVSSNQPLTPTDARKTPSQSGSIIACYNSCDSIVAHNMTLGAGQSIPPDDKQLHQMLLEQRNSRPTYQRIYDDIPDDVIIETDSGNRQPAATQRENCVVT